MKAIELYIVRYIYRHNTFSGPAISNATVRIGTKGTGLDDVKIKMSYKKGLNLRKMVWRSVYYGKSDFDVFSHFWSGVSVKNSERNI